MRIGVSTPAAEVARHAQRHAGVQLQRCRSDRGQIGREAFLDAQIGGDEMDAPVVHRLDERVGVAVDRGVEHRAAVLVAIGAEIGAAARQAEAQRHAGADGGHHPAIMAEFAIEVIPSVERRRGQIAAGEKCAGDTRGCGGGKVGGLVADQHAAGRIEFPGADQVEQHAGRRLAPVADAAIGRHRAVRDGTDR